MNGFQDENMEEIEEFGTDDVSDPDCVSDEDILEKMEEDEED